MTLPTGEMAETQPRKAATVVLLAEEKVLMVERARSLPYLGGFHGFPGGAVESGDGDLPAQSSADRGTRAAVLRELFEETGLLLSVPEADRALARQARERIARKEITLRAYLRENGLRLATARLIEAGNWLTPSFSLPRFDTSFYLAALRRAIPPGAPSRELAGLEWVEPQEALRRWENHEILLVPPTKHLLRSVSGGRNLKECSRAALSIPEARRAPTRRIELRSGIILFPARTKTLPPATHTNTLLFGEGEMAVIDPASARREEKEALLALIAELAGEGRKAKQIVLTHHHADHIGGVALLKEELGLPVAAHPATAFLLRDQIRVDRPLSDGDRIKLEGPRRRELEVLHTPGHAPGHLCFFEEATQTLIAGDNVLGHGSVLINPPQGNMDQYLASLDRMKRLGARLLIGGHGTVVGDPRSYIGEYIHHRLERERAILAAVAVKPLTPSDIVRQVYTDLLVETRPLAERSVLAHLIRLADRGLVGREGEHYHAHRAADPT